MICFRKGDDGFLKQTAVHNLNLLDQSLNEVPRKEAHHDTPEQSEQAALQPVVALK